MTSTYEKGLELHERVLGGSKEPAEPIITTNEIFAMASKMAFWMDWVRALPEE